MISIAKPTTRQRIKKNYRESLSSVALRSRAVLRRNHIEFAESSIVHSEGKFKDHRFDADRQPYVRAILEAYDSGLYRRFVAVGCVQSGKTFISVVEVLLYHACELAQTCIVAAPTMDMCEDKWLTEIKPVLDASPSLSMLLPTDGKGIRGFAAEIKLKNGGVIKFMSAGGGDTQRSGYTAEVIIITEVDKMDVAGDASQETDPITQFISRAEGFGEDGVVYLESTLTDEDGRIWVEANEGTFGELYSQCPHCGEFVLPGREHIAGYKEARDAIEVKDNAHWLCPSCSKKITEAQRIKMLKDVRVVCRGQKIDKRGRITGDMPRTETHSIRWTAWHNLFWTTAHIAKGEWQCWTAEQSESTRHESLEKKQCQFVWMEPYKAPDMADYQLEAKTVRHKATDDWDRGIIPPNWTQFGIGCDIGKSTCWWVALVGCQESRTLHVPAYGAFTVESDLDSAVDFALMNSLMEWRDTIVEPGFVVHGTDDRLVASDVWIDRGYKADVVQAMVRQSGPLRGNRYRCCLGRGASVVDFEGKTRSYRQPSRKSRVVRELGDNWFGQVNHEAKVMESVWNADHFKRWAQARLATPVGSPGCMTLFRDTTGSRFKEHSRFSMHVTNERFVIEKNKKPEWKKTGQNHWLDALSQACAALHRAGFKLAEDEAATGEKEVAAWFASAKK